MPATKQHFELVNQVYDQPDNTLMLIGSALDGPSQIPFKIRGDINPYDALGDCKMADAYYSALASGLENIILYRINGSHAEAFIKPTYREQPVIHIESVSAADEFNKVIIRVFIDHIYIIASDETGRVYSFDDYPTAADITYAINRDSEYGLVEVSAKALDPNFKMLGIVDETTDISLTGGNDEAELIPLREENPDISFTISNIKERLLECLFGLDKDDQADRNPNSVIGSMNYGVICLVDIFHDDDKEITEILGSFCLNKTRQLGTGTLGVIGTSPILEPTEEDIKLKYDSLMLDKGIEHREYFIIPSEEEAPPTLNVTLEQNDTGEWEAHLNTTNFIISDEGLYSGEEIDYDEGYADIYIDGKKVDPAYNNIYSVGDLRPGDHKVKVSLKSYDHRFFLYKGEVIEKTVEVTIAGDELVKAREVDPDALYYVQVVVGDGRLINVDRVISNAYSYAATQALIPYHASMTNKSLSGISKIHWKFRKEDIATLSGNGYTCIVPSIRKGIVAFSSISYGKKDASVLSKPQYLRLAQNVVSALHEDLEEYIGSTYEALLQNDVQDKAEEMLEELIEDKSIKTYTFEMSFSEDRRSAVIHIGLVPFSEIEAVHSVTSVSFQEGVIVE